MARGSGKAAPRPHEPVSEGDVRARSPGGVWRVAGPEQPVQPQLQGLGEAIGADLLFLRACYSGLFGRCPRLDSTFAQLRDLL